jgi:prolyl-tRNA synthetase
VLRLSTLFLRTLREDPADAEVPSHKLLVRGGYVRRIAPGIYSWLPLGYLVYRNIERVVREEMDNAGFQEVHFPGLLPREPYEETNRWTEYGDNLFRLKDRKGADYLLAPTHEEVFTLMVKGEYSSYKDLPLSIYQIQIKYRDESRPRAGILRGREFVMKDSYSFDTSKEGLVESYNKHRDAYIKTFNRLGMDYVIVSAMSGAMGGSGSEEFLAICDSGEDTYVQCPSCGLAANVEAIVTKAPAEIDFANLPSAHVENTPDTPTIATLVDVSNNRAELRRADRDWQASDTLKNVVLMEVTYDGTRKPLIVGLPGDREVDLKRLEAALHPSAIEPFEEDDFKKYPVLVKGYIGPQVLGEKSQSGIRYLVDPRVVNGTRWITGANKPGHHVYDLVAGRDFSWDGVIEAAEVREGDTCSNCDAKLEMARGIEIGHIFQLGLKYSEALDLKVLDENGKLIPVHMGSYGIGVSRAVAVVAEQWHDEKGLIWPREIAPADIHIIATGKDEVAFETAEKFAAELEERGVRVLFDDRKGVSPGVKFNDSELIGVPTIAVLGKGLAEGVIELRDRKSGQQRNVPIEQFVAEAYAEVKGI